MPHIEIKGVKKETILKIQDEMISSLAEIINKGKDYFILTLDTNYTYYPEESYPIIKISLFKRPKEILEKMTKSINNILNREGYKDIEVFFTYLDSENYFIF